MKKGLLIVLPLIIIVPLLLSSCDGGSKYTCAECGNKFSGQPYQCIMYNCVKAKTVSSALPTFDSCSCGVAYMRRQGFAYSCR
jgi:hypothetical protein